MGVKCQYLGQLPDHPHLTFPAVHNPNPVTWLPDDDPDVLLHNYEDLLEISQASCPDLQDTNLSEAEADFFTDGSSLDINGVRSTAAAVTTQWDTI